MSNGSNSEGQGSRNGSSGPVEVYAPFAGVLHLQVKTMQTVSVGDPVAVVEAVKLEAPVPAPCSGVVTSIFAAPFHDVSGGDLLMTIAPSTSADADVADAGDGEDA